MTSIATARSHPNIALIKYWGKRDTALNLPAVPSLSLTLSQFHTTTTVHWGTAQDHFTLNGKPQEGSSHRKVFDMLNIVDPNRPKCKVISENNFPTAAGLASSSSAFSALAMAATEASGQSISQEALSVLARRGSGSACRSLWEGWVEWKMGERQDGTDSHGVPIASKDHWDVRMVVAVVSDQAKSLSSRAGMLATQETSPMYPAWCQTGPADVTLARQAILDKDMEALGFQMEHSTLKMFSTMFTTTPSIRYWKPQTLALIDMVERLRDKNIPCWYTMDAGPNVKILCSAEHATQISAQANTIVDTIHVLEPGDGSHLC